MKELAILNRQRLLTLMAEDSLMVIFAGKDINRSADESYPFSINRNFYYLTMIDEPYLILVLRKDKEGMQEILYIEEADPLFEKWVGKKMTAPEAKVQSGIADIRYLENFEEELYQFSGECQFVYFDVEDDKKDNIVSLGWKQLVEEKHPAVKLLDAYPLLASLRAVKSAAEVKEIQKAIHITDLGLQEVLKSLRPGIREYEIEAEFAHVLNKHHSHSAFTTIAASGSNATTLHYVKNDDLLEDNSLILFDLGASSRHYCADISRTYPVNGKFTARQKELYEMVLTINKEIIAAVRVGVTLAELNQKVIDYYKVVLKEKGIIENEEEVKNYYYHGVSHSLGLDTHDIGLSRDEKLVAGNVVTVEPGIYIKEEGIGIRIEDDVLVTEDGSINLSEAIIKEVADIEALMRK